MRSYNAEVNESGIVWLDDPAKYPYVRETTIYAPFRSRMPSRKRMQGRPVAIAGLNKEARAVYPGMFLRRYWYVAPHDPYYGGPIEAVDPYTVCAGVKSIHPKDRDEWTVIGYLQWHKHARSIDENAGRYEPSYRKR